MNLSSRDSVSWDSGKWLWWSSSIRTSTSVIKARMVTISESDGAKLDFKRWGSGDLGMPLSAQRLLMVRNIRNGNALTAFNVKCCLMLRPAFEPEGAWRMVVSVEFRNLWERAHRGRHYEELVHVECVVIDRSVIFPALIGSLRTLHNLCAYTDLPPLPAGLR